MKSLTLLILILTLLNYINSASSCHLEDDTYDSPEYRDGDDCAKRGFSDEELENNAYKCCLMKYKYETSNMDRIEYDCVPITQEEYNDIDKFIDSVEDNYDKLKIDFTIKKLDCKSNYLKTILILSLSLLFL